MGDFSMDDGDPAVDPEGIADISRWLSEAIPPEKEDICLYPKGVIES